MHVVTAFAVGHSTTLALASLGVVHAPSRLVESLIALSILVSALHAIRPLVPRGEPLIAGGFGLVHGLAFASLLGSLGLRGRELVASLLGFNLGIELTQLLVVALMMPSLYLLSRTALYDVVRVRAVRGHRRLASPHVLKDRSNPRMNHKPLTATTLAIAAAGGVIACGANSGPTASATAASGGSTGAAA